MNSSITMQTKSILTNGLTPAMVAAVFLVFSVGTSAYAGDGSRDNPRIFPPQSQPYGKAYNEWSAAWWQWAGSIPAANHPILDQTGDDAAVNQSGKVWFLAGTFGGASER